MLILQKLATHAYAYVAQNYLILDAGSALGHRMDLTDKASVVLVSRNYWSEDCNTG